MRLKTWAFVKLGLLGFVIGWPAAVSSNQPPVVIEELTIAGADFKPGMGREYTVTASGLTIAGAAFTAVYTSSEIEAPIAFNAVVPYWRAIVPEGTTLEIRLRTRAAAGEWSQWFHLHAHDDWSLSGEELAIGDVITVAAEEETHRIVQFSASLSREMSLLAPRLNQFGLTFIDSTAGPTTAELLARQRALDEAQGAGNGEVAAGYARPAVVSRQVWCTDPACLYSEGLEYRPATHLVVHHTATSNSSSDWAATIRAIWRIHTDPPSPSCTICRGWGDIGYNYLVDQNGVIYEGHFNADYDELDVIGVHASAANTGSMGVALLGTFTTPAEDPVTSVPPPAMLNATADLLAWKASQRGIDVYGAARLPNVDWGLPQLMGHRDVHGGTGTLCPGGELHNLLPWLRDQVAARLNYTPPYVTVDELSSAFSHSNTPWLETPGGCGYNGHAYYAWSTTDPAQSSNWGEWQPAIPEDGRYWIWAYAPYCDTGRAETGGAAYEIHHADGIKRVTASHQANVGLWIFLGEFELKAGDSTRIRLTDLTATDSGVGVWFDAIRLQNANSLPHAIMLPVVIGK